MTVVSAIAAIVGCLGAVLILLLLVPIEVVARAEVRPTRLDASAAASWGLGVAGLQATPRDGIQVRLLGRDVARWRSTAQSPEPVSTPAPKERSRGWRPTLGFVRSVLKRTVRTVRPRARLSGHLGTGDPSESATLFVALAASRHWLPTLDTEHLHVDWLDATMDVQGQVEGTLWPAAIAWIVATELIKTRQSSRT
ncbi:MAG: hypothetical protein KTR31_29615 [Myxococcales bacterium]|nr:hypothetical protein [Myxococcales bacterium]